MMTQFETLFELANFMLNYLKINEEKFFICKFCLLRKQFLINKIKLCFENN